MPCELMPLPLTAHDSNARTMAASMHAQKYERPYPVPCALFIAETLKSAFSHAVAKSRLSSPMMSQHQVKSPLRFVTGINGVFSFFAAMAAVAYHDAVRFGSMLTMASGSSLLPHEDLLD